MLYSNAVKLFALLTSSGIAASVTVGMLIFNRDDKPLVQVSSEILEDIEVKADEFQNQKYYYDENGTNDGTSSPRTEEQLKSMEEVLKGKKTLTPSQGTPTNELGKPVDVVQDDPQENGKDLGDTTDDSQLSDLDISLPAPKVDGESSEDKQKAAMDVEANDEGRDGKELQKGEKGDISDPEESGEKNDLLSSSKDDRGEDEPSLSGSKPKEVMDEKSESSEDSHAGGDSSEEGSRQCKPCKDKEKQDANGNSDEEKTDLSEENGKDPEKNEDRSMDQEPQSSVSEEDNSKTNDPLKSLEITEEGSPSSKKPEDSSSLGDDVSSEEHGGNGVLNEETGRSDLARQEQIDRLKGLSDELNSLIDQLQVKFSL